MTSGTEPLVGLVGDLMLRAASARDRRAADAGYDAAIAALAPNRFVIANLEMPLSTRGYRVPKHSNLRSDPERIEDVVGLGIDAVTLANNHMMDYGPDALMDTIAACERVDLPTAGAGIDLAAALNALVMEVDGTKVGLLSVAATLPMESEAGPGKPGIAPIHVEFALEIDSNLLVEQPGTMPIVRSWANAEEQDRLCSTITELKSRVDVVIVAIHWGVPAYWLSPYQGLLASYQQPLGRALVDAGADVICGHHSHSLHPIEIYRGKPIFYSLGNFIFEQPRDFMQPESIIASVTPGNPFRIDMTPLWLDQEGFPQLATASRADDVLAKLEHLSAPFGTRMQRRDDRACIVMA